MSCSWAARRTSSQLGVGEAELAADQLGEVGDVVDVVAQLAVVLGGDAQQHLMDGLVVAAPAAALGAYMRWSASRSASTASGHSAGSSTAPCEQPIVKRSPDSRSAAAARATSASGSSHAAGRRARRTRRRPSGRRCAWPAVVSVRLRPSRASSASPAEVAEGVVVGLEAVEVEERQHRGPLGGVGDDALEVAQQRAAVAEAGQRVGRGLDLADAEQLQVLAEDEREAHDGGRDRRAARATPRPR